MKPANTSARKRRTTHLHKASKHLGQRALLGRKVQLAAQPLLLRARPHQRGLHLWVVGGRGAT